MSDEQQHTAELNCHCDDCEKQRALRDAGWYFAPGGIALPPGWTWGAA